MCPLFSPPLFMQRYQFAVDFVAKSQPKWVLDLGCAECRLLSKLKFLGNGVELLVGVDKDVSVMRSRMLSFAPLSSDYLQPRSGPLTIELYQGSVTQADPITRGFDLVTCLELVEHLYMEEVETFSQVLFGYMAPKVAIISTPNADFNPLLPGLIGLRHPDHKFEWTREQFQSWALRLCEVFGYTVSFTGVGLLEDSESHVGFCSQIAVFTRDPGHDNVDLQCHSREEPTVYKLLYSVVYPSLSDNNILQRTLVNQVLNQAEDVKRLWLSGELSRSQAAAAAAAPEPYWQGSSVCVSLLDVWACPKVKSLCGTLRRFQEALVGETRVQLTPARDAIVLPGDDDDDEDDEDYDDEGYEEDEGCEEREGTAPPVTEDWDAEMSAQGDVNLPGVLVENNG